MSEQEEMAFKLAKLQALLDHLETATIALLKRAEKAEAEIVALREILKQCEWSSWDKYDDACCPICIEAKKDGHSPDCALAAALKEAAK